MKKLINTAIVLLCVFTARSQKTYVTGGVNLANITSTNDGGTQKNNTLTSFNAGLLHRFGLTPFFAVETGLLFTGKGSKAETYFSNNDYVKTKFNPYYIELPLNAVVKFPVTPGGNHFFLHAGPYAAVGVAGKAKTNSNIGLITSSSEENIKFSNDDPLTSEGEDAGYDRLKRFDFGLNFGAGFSFKHVLLRANYGLGLTRINSTQTDNDANDRNKFRTVSFSVGIPF